ncbi:MAG: tetratricopeptide repeat protein [Bacteroidales bacterium]|nr:tetratricopeptide repeat protein [Bacteroidales bacterium]MDT8372928.1 tetratricopeptide repeat protein [Bacteroidales bacterium]
MRNRVNITRVIVTALGILLALPSLSAQEEREYIRKGNRLYKKSEFAGSEGMYRRAQERSTEDAGFNLGNALYKQGRYGEAADEFGRSAVAGETDTVRQAQSLYNLGNSLIKEQKYEEGIRAYINSLTLDPGNIQAKYNLAWAQDQLQQQEQQQNKDQNQDQQEDNKENEKNDDQQESDDQQQEEKPQDQQQEEQPQEQEGQQQEQSISREDAKRLLDALAANEKETQEKVQREKAAKARVRVIKNW